MPAKAARTGAIELEQALLEFQAAPGRHRTAQREPALLFSRLDEVIQLAIGRAEASVPVSQAAQGFIREALFAADADHYALLGLVPSAPAAEIKTRYRLLMRLLHPDFGSNASDWRADAAVRVNVAYETLSSTQRRLDYDKLLDSASPAKPARAPTAGRPKRKRPAPKSRGLRLRGPAGRAAIAASFLIGMALMALLFITNQGPADELVQRAPPTEAPVIRGALDAVVHAAQNLSAAVGAGDPIAAPAAAQTPASPAAQPEPPTPAAPTAVAEPVEAAKPVTEPAAPAVAATEAPPPAPVQATSPVLVQARPAPAAAAPSAAVPASAPVRIVPAGPSIADAQPLLLQLLQRMESGNGDELVALLERPSRGSQESQALAREFSQLAQGSRTHIAGVQFRGEPREGRLLVRGVVKLRIDDSQQPLDFKLLAEFAQRDGEVVLMRLAPVAR